MHFRVSQLIGLLAGWSVGWLVGWALKGEGVTLPCSTQPQTSHATKSFAKIQFAVSLFYLIMSNIFSPELLLL